MRKYLLTILGAIVFAFTASTTASAQAGNQFDQKFEPALSDADKAQRDWDLGRDLQRDRDEREKEQRESPGIDIGRDSVTDKGPKDSNSGPADRRGKPDNQ